MSDQGDNNQDTVEGTITEALPNALFRVELPDGTATIVYLAGKMRLHRIKVLVGDTVSIHLDPYGGKGRIVRRF